MNVCLHMREQRCGSAVLRRRLIGVFLFHCLDSRISLVSKSEISNVKLLASVAVRLELFRI